MAAYVCVYGNELQDNHGVRFPYGDSVWINGSTSMELLIHGSHNNSHLEPSRVELHAYFIIKNSFCRINLLSIDMYWFPYFCNMMRCNDTRISPKKNFTTEEAVFIAKYLNIKFDKFDVEQFRIGLNVELEHGRINPLTNITNDEPIMTGKITLAHLNEYPDYYKRLTKMEEEAEEYLGD